MNSKKKKKKEIFEPEYTAFLPIGIAFMTLSFALDDMWAFLPVGIVFFVIGVSYGIPWQRMNKKGSNNRGTEE